jgi:phage tail tape-measure protein
MSTKRAAEEEEAAGVPHAGAHALAEELAAEAAAGAAVGAAAGVIAGPAGMAIGAFLGGAIGAAVGEVLHLDHEAAARRDEQLDKDIGVSGGDLGAASPNQPPSRGVFHSASMGVSHGTGSAPSEGPIQDIDEDG